MKNDTLSVISYKGYNQKTLLPVKIKQATFAKSLTTKHSPTYKPLKQVKANNKIAHLAHILRRGSELEKYSIDPNNPPKDITYEMLFNEIGYEGNKGKSKLLFEPSIDEKNILRIKWWKIWYQIITGYSSYGKVSRAPLSQKKLKKLLYGTDTNSSSGSSTSEKYGGTGGTHKSNARKIAELIKIKDDFLSKLEVDSSLYKLEKKYFNNSYYKARKLIKNALQILYNVEDLTPEEIIVLTNNSKINYPAADDYATLYQPTKVLNIYGMQLPHQFDRLKLFKTMLYLLSKKKIYNFVDLHDCEGGTNKMHDNIIKGIGCNPYDRQAELLMWDKAITALITQHSDETKGEYEKNTHFYGINEYVDMTPGSPATWESISRIKDTKIAKNSVVVHCLAGAGRTGSVILFLLLRDAFEPAETIERLQKPHYGYKDISEFIETYDTMLDNDDNENDIEYMKNEIFHVSEQVSASRFRQRLNRIFFFLARHFKVNKFFTYDIPIATVINLPNDEFANQVLRKIEPISDVDAWSNFDKRSAIDWFN